MSRRLLAEPIYEQLDDRQRTPAMSYLIGAIEARLAWADAVSADEFEAMVANAVDYAGLW